MMKTTRIWLTAVTLVFLLCTSSQSFAMSSWPMYQANPSHTGSISILLDPAKFSFLWQKTVAGGSELSPAVAGDGKVFVSRRVYFSPGPSFFALDALTGTTVWSKEYPEAFSVNDPSYMDGRVYFQTCNHSTDTYLRVYDAETGALVYRSPHSAQWERYLAPTIYQGVIYVNAGSYGGMYAFDQASGTQLWANTSLPQYDMWTPAIDETYAYAYLGDYLPGLYVLDRLTGATVFIIADPLFSWNGWSMRQSPVLLSNGRVLAANNGRLINFDTVTRAIAWEQTGGYSEQPVVSHGVIYANKAGALIALDELTGETLWMWEPPIGQLTGPMIVTDTHAIASTSTATYAIDLATHTDVWNYGVGGKLTIGNDHLYIAATTGTLTAISLGKTHSAPVAVAGQDRVVIDNVFLDGSGSYDEDGTIVSYAWTIAHRDDSICDRSARTATVFVADLCPGFYDVTLVVADNEGWANSDSFVLAVASGNDEAAVVNGSFESGIIDPWLGKNLSETDNIVRGKGRFKSAGFRMRGSASNKLLSQNILVSGRAGEFVTLSGWSKAANAPSGGGTGAYAIELRLYYTDGTYASVLAKFRRGTHGWELKSGTIFAEKDYEHLSIRLRYSLAAGSVFFDDIRLTRW